MLALLAAYLVFGEFDESDPAQNGSGADSSTASQTADENNGLSENCLLYTSDAADEL